MVTCSSNASASGISDKATQAPPTVAFNIPRQAADDSLPVFGQQADVTVIYPFERVKGHQTNRLQGEYSITRAVAILLDNTGLAATFSPEGHLVISQVQSKGKSMNIQTKKTLLATLIGLFSAGGVATATGQEQVTNSARAQVGLDEIIVTAQKREEKIQDVPMSIMALTSEDLEKIGFSDIGDISDKIPALSIQADFNSASSLKIYIRGVGQEAPSQFERDNGVGIYMDDVYMAHGNGLSAELSDIERIEVLSGPQGTLYGRNTVGGAVKFISSKPKGEWGFKENIDVGDFGLFRSVTTLDLPAVNGLSSKFSVLQTNKDGWVRNAGSGGDFGDRDASGYRAAFRWEPAEEWIVDYVYDYVDQNSISLYQQHGYAQIFPFSIPIFEDRQETTWRPGDLPMKDDFTTSGHALTAQWDVTDQVSIKSISSYREFDGESLHDGMESYNTANVVYRKSGQHQFSQEFLLSGNSANDRIKYHVGLFYFEESAAQQFTTLANNAVVAQRINDALLAGLPIEPPTLADLAPISTLDIENESSAVYGQITWTPPILNDRVTIDLGARYSKDDRTVASNKPRNLPPLLVDESGSASSNSFDPALTVDYRWTDNVHTYLRYAQAYRSGGFDTANSILSSFDPEELDSYEVGLKSNLLENRMQLNLAVFRQEYKDIQIQYFDPGFGGIPGTRTVNAGEATTNGAEAEIQYLPVAGLLFTAAAAYLDSETIATNPYTTVTAARPLFNLPRWKYNIGAEYSSYIAGKGLLSANISYDYRDQELGSGAFVLTDFKPDYGVLGARISLSEIDMPMGELTVALWGKNLTDKEYQIYHNYGSVIYGEPRSFGLNLIYKY